jgi:hypothetical protein
VYTDSLRLEEWHMYGSSRIGIYQTNKAMAQRTVRIENGITTQLSNTHIEQLSLSRFYTERGAKRYELTNHLGNVLSVVTDKKLPVCSGTSVSYFIADVVSATDYSPFGAPLAERTWQGSEYRYGFNTQERDDEIAGKGNIMTAEYWEYDTRLGRRWNLDPIVKPWESGYACFFNNAILINDPLGLDGEKPNEKRITEQGCNEVFHNGSWQDDKSILNEVVITDNKPRNKLFEVLGKFDDELHNPNSNLSKFVEGIGKTITELHPAVPIYNIGSRNGLWGNGNNFWGEQSNIVEASFDYFFFLPFDKLRKLTKLAKLAKINSAIPDIIQRGIHFNSKGLHVRLIVVGEKLFLRASSNREASNGLINEAIYNTQIALQNPKTREKVIQIAKGALQNPQISKYTELVSELELVIKYLESIK